MGELVIRLPDKDTPGYLRRLIQADGFREKMREADNRPEFYEALVEFLLTYVLEPADRDEARELLMDASKEQYDAMLKVVNSGGAANPTQAQESETN